MKQYMLDTNTVSYLLKGHHYVTQRVISAPMNSLCISAITEGELLFGLAKRPQAKTLHQLVKEFLKRVDTLPWDNSTAEQYGSTRAKMAQKGKTLAPLDLLIATHALSLNAALVTNDKAFIQVPELIIEDWSIP
jgi:tRNA(fMet)-specific endonuclease VapC